jgi:hypothetical protein
MRVVDPVEVYARQRMRAGELLTWHHDRAARRVTFFVPEDVDEATYPSQLEGNRVELRKLPRPVAPTRRW